MKYTIASIVLLFTVTLFGQNHVNLKKGFAAEGYDVVAYFSNEAVKGDKKIEASHKDVKYLFTSEENRLKFQKDPERYIPQYGGYCAYAIGAKGKKVSVNPKSFQIIDDKLYLFYDGLGGDTLEKWNEEGSAELQKKADANWKIIVAEQ